MVYNLCLGSPPRVRGKAEAAGLCPRNAGITPARAGKSAHRSSQSRAFRDHPRACGEKPSWIEVRGYAPGSPPRVRGKGRNSRQKPHKHGITPARAGKSTLPFSMIMRRRDHPRACGEKHIAEWATLIRSGSPPRVRGKADRKGSAASRAGITPARAGKSNPQRCYGCWNRDHPRACGEKCRMK